MLELTAQVLGEEKACATFRRKQNKCRCFAVKKEECRSTLCPCPQVRLLSCQCQVRSQMSLYDRYLSQERTKGTTREKIRPPVCIGGGISLCRTRRPPRHVAPAATHLRYCHHWCSSSGSGLPPITVLMIFCDSNSNLSCHTYLTVFLWVGAPLEMFTCVWYTARFSAVTVLIVEAVSL